MLRVKSICKQRGITLKELAERMSVTPEVITRMLSNNGNPTLSTLMNMAKALDLPVYELFDDFDKNKLVRGYVETEDKVYRINNLSDLESVYNTLIYNKI